MCSNMIVHQCTKQGLKDMAETGLHRVLTSTKLERRRRARASRPTSVCDLTNANLEEWSKIPINTHLNLVETLPRRVKSSYSCKGWTDVILNSMSKGPEGISPRLLKSCADQLCRVVEYIFNISLKLAKVPMLWKTSCVVPVLKIPHPKDFNS